MCKVLLNEKLNGVELYFEGKPAGTVLADLKATSRNSISRFKS